MQAMADHSSSPITANPQSIINDTAVESIKVENQLLKETIESMRTESIMNVSVETKFESFEEDERHMTLIKELFDCKKKLAEATLSPEVYILLILCQVAEVSCSTSQTSVTNTETQCDPPLALFSIALQTEDPEENIPVEISPVIDMSQETSESSMKLESLAVLESDSVSDDPDTIYRLKIQMLCRKLQEADAQLLRYEKDVLKK
jgi:hypothetical protein